MFGSLKRSRSDVFRMDLRSLAIMRILFSISLLIDLYERSVSFIFTYTDLGPFKRDLVIRTHPQESVSFLFIDGSVEFAVLHFALHVLFIFMLLVGYRTQLASICVFLFHVSLVARLEELTAGGDAISRVYLFCFMFLPLGERMSVDYTLKKLKEKKNEERKSEEHSSVATFGTALFKMQMFILYWMTGVLKSGPTWRRDYTATYYSFSMIQESGWVAQWIALHFEPFLKYATFFVIYWELAGPFLLLFPFGNDVTTYTFALSLVGMHIGMGITLNFVFIGLFIGVPISAAIGIFPSFWWSRFPWLERFFERFFEQIVLRAQSFSRGSVFVLLMWLLRWGKNVFLLFCIFAILRSNYLHHTDEQKMRTEFTGVFLDRIQLGQGWNLFAPDPPTIDCWYIMQVHLTNGTILDIGKFGSWFYPKTFPLAFISKKEVQEMNSDELISLIPTKFIWDYKEPDLSPARARLVRMLLMLEEGEYTAIDMFMSWICKNNADAAFIDYAIASRDIRPGNVRGTARMDQIVYFDCVNDKRIKV